MSTLESKVLLLLYSRENESSPRPDPAMVRREREFQESSTETGYLTGAWLEENDRLVRRWYWLDYLSETSL